MRDDADSGGAVFNLENSSNICPAQTDGARARVNKSAAAQQEYRVANQLSSRYSKLRQSSSDSKSNELCPRRFEYCRLRNVLFKDLSRRIRKVAQCRYVCIYRTSSRGRVVKALDSKSNGLCPRRFESCRLRNVLFKDLRRTIIFIYGKLRAHYRGETISSSALLDLATW
jgi:hypothetical protein